ncbi:MAG: MiaB/RimO family radical SAM methylthiotransferase [Candidatus Fermentibacteraceae bacterium]
MPGPDRAGRACLVTFGCPKNETDTEGFAAVLSAAGWRLADDPEAADLLLVNTCAFIRPAVEESMDYLLSAMDWKRRQPGRRLVLAGCLPARYADDGSGGLEDLDLVVGPGDLAGLARFLDVDCPGHLRLPVEGEVVRYLKISDGCSNRCAFCTIPAIRGPYVSVGRDHILLQAKAMAEQGAAEIGLVGQDCGLWRDGGLDLADLLDRLSRLHPDIWWRSYYIHPAHMPERLLDLMEERENVMPYLDLPMQHASDRVLLRMGRPYGEEHLRGIMRRVEAADRRIAVRATVIAGYPGETGEDFRRLLDFLGEYPSIRNLVAFPYYSEPGTREHGRDGDRPSESAVRERLAELSAVAEAAWLRWDGVLGEGTFAVLVDEAGRGHTMYDAPGVDAVCRFRGRHPGPGTVAEVEVISSEGSDIFVHCVPGPKAGPAGANR